MPRALLKEANHRLIVRLNEPGTLLELMTRAYPIVDKVSREVVSALVTCTRGCLHCCRIDVQITTFEAEYIASLPSGTGALPVLLQFRRVLDLRLSAAVLALITASVTPGYARLRVRSSGSGMQCDMGNGLYRGVATWIHFQNRYVSGDIKDIRDFFAHDPAAMHRDLAVSPPRLPV